MSTPGAPRSLLILDTTQETWEIDQKALNSVLDKVGNIPLVIYSINGISQTGKSFLLSHFIYYFETQKKIQDQHFSSNFSFTDVPRSSSNYFEWRDSIISRTTVGIHIWSEPYFVKIDNDNENQVAVLLIDTEGIFNIETTKAQNAVVFTLCSLLSSVLMFNHMKILNDHILQSVQEFSNFALLIQKTLNENPLSNERLSQLLFVLRDFELKEFKYGIHDRSTSMFGNYNNYYLTIFHKDGDFVINGNSKDKDGNFLKNYPLQNWKTRQDILNAFEYVATFLLPRPDTKFLMDAQPEIDPPSNSKPQSLSESSDDFRQCVQSFVETMVTPKILAINRKKTGTDGNVFTGMEFKDMLIKKFDRKFLTYLRAEARSSFGSSADAVTEQTTKKGGNRNKWCWSVFIGIGIVAVAASVGWAYCFWSQPNIVTKTPPEIPDLKNAQSTTTVCLATDFFYSFWDTSVVVTQL